MDTSSAADRAWMAEALRLASGGRFRVEPNPLVGAVVVRDGAVVGRGFHAAFGGPHAEVVALEEAGERSRGATLVVTLEPCAHHGKTPPCVEAILAAGIARVLYAADDPNPLTAGRGPVALRAAGVSVEGGLLAPEARDLNRRCVAHLAADVPWTIAKWAMTLDGKIADVVGGSRDISCPAAHELAHEVRGSVDAVAAGVGTVLRDDPLLTARGGRRTRDAVRLVLDTGLRVPIACRLVATARERPTWVAAGESASIAGERRLVAAGCRVVRVPERGGHLDLRELFRLLRREGLQRVLLEGGGEVHASAFEAGVVRQVMVFVAPRILGGAGAPTPIGGPGLRRIAAPLELEEAARREVGTDVLFEGYVSA